MANAWVFVTTNGDSNLFSSTIVNASAFPESDYCGLEQCSLCGLVQFSVLGGRGVVADRWFDRCLSGVAFL